MSAVASEVPPLAHALAHRRWLRRTHPFRHVVARDVFARDVYDELAHAFAGTLDHGLKIGGRTFRFARSGGGYDAYALSFRRGITGPFALFTSTAWHDMLAGMFAVRVTSDVDAGLHHHEVGSDSGHVHNDFNPGWFVDAPATSGVNLSNADLCNYRNGATSRPDVQSHETVRAIAMLYYLNNAPWRPGDGGETGLFSYLSGPIDRPAATAPPVNNTLLAFECTPYSYHAFLSNRTHARNSVILWLHRPKTDAVGQWGANAIVHWPKH